MFGRRDPEDPEECDYLVALDFGNRRIRRELQQRREGGKEGDEWAGTPSEGPLAQGLHNWWPQEFAKGLCESPGGEEKETRESIKCLISISDAPVHYAVAMICEDNIIGIQVTVLVCFGLSND